MAVMQKVTHLLVRIALGILIGMTIASLIWIGYLWGNGKGVGQAMRGQVEDGIAKLEGLLALGMIIGIPVGLFWGLSTVPGSDSK